VQPLNSVLISLNTFTVIRGIQGTPAMMKNAWRKSSGE